MTYVRFCGVAGFGTRRVLRDLLVCALLRTAIGSFWRRISVPFRSNELVPAPCLKPDFEPTPRSDNSGEHLVKPLCRGSGLRNLLYQCLVAEVQERIMRQQTARWFNIIRHDSSYLEDLASRD